MPTNQMHLIAASLAEIKYEERIEIDKSIYYTSTDKINHTAKYDWLPTTNNEITKYHLLA